VGSFYRRDNESDKKQVKSYDIPSIDLVIVDLYPFEETVAAGGEEQEIIEKIDIGGFSYPWCSQELQGCACCVFQTSIQASA